MAVTTKTIFESAYEGDFETVKLKIIEDNKRITAVDDNARMLVHWAALGGHEEIVSYVLGLGSPVDPRDDTDMTPLILASSAGREKIVRLLIGKGANLNAVNDGGHSALQYAASKGWKEIVEMLLLNHADINVRDHRSATPLHRAASKGNTEILKLLLQHGSHLDIDARDSAGNTALISDADRNASRRLHPCSFHHRRCPPLRQMKCPTLISINHSRIAQILQILQLSQPAKAYNLQKGTWLARRTERRKQDCWLLKAHCWT